MRTKTTGALGAVLTALVLSGCASVDPANTREQVDRYCVRVRAYAVASDRLAAETDQQAVATDSEAANDARGAMERATPPSMLDDYFVTRDWKVMSGEERASDENRSAYLMAEQRLDAFREEHCTLG